MQGKTVESIDTAKVFTVYALSAAVVGLVLFAWGPLLFRLGRQEASMIRVVGAVLTATACFAWPIRSADPVLRRRALFWFAGGYWLVDIVVEIQAMAIWGHGLADYARAGLGMTAMLLMFIGATSEGMDPIRKVHLASLLQSLDESSHRLRSRYEEQISAAARQEERNRLARDLHDSVKQQLFAIQTAAAATQTRFDGDPPGAKAALEQVRGAARDAMAEMEAMLDQLQAAPLENAGLLEALKKQCQALQLRTGAAVDLKIGDLPPSELLTPGTHEAIFRVAQEALANVAKHARAKNVSVVLGADGGEVDLRVADDGKGYDPKTATKGMGLANMRARAKELGGRFVIRPSDGGGTQVKLAISYWTPNAKTYRNFALFSGAMLIFMATLAAIRPTLMRVPATAFIGFGFARSLYVYLKLRKQPWSIR